jgi:ubiquinone/menaquinone biosynthesis C-methylase UbiE
MSNKYRAELSYWKKCFEKEGYKLNNSWYQRLFLGISGKDYEWFSGKSILDFGSGPRGSLEWADNAENRVCCDVLADEYAELGTKLHKAKYLRCTEDAIPVESNYFDVSFTINSIDHTEDPPLMTREILRVTKLGGAFGGSINLNEPPTPSEPNQITLDFFNVNISPYIIVERLLVAPKNSGDGGVYKHLEDFCKYGTSLPPLAENEIGYLWFFGTVYRKPVDELRTR